MCAALALAQEEPPQEGTVIIPVVREVRAPVNQSEGLVAMAQMAAGVGELMITLHSMVSLEVSRVAEERDVQVVTALAAAEPRSRRIRPASLL